MVFTYLGVVSPFKSVEGSATTTLVVEQLKGQQVQSQLHQSMIGNAGIVPIADTVPTTLDD